jgi:DNA-binding NtrC family response regulator
MPPMLGTVRGVVNRRRRESPAVGDPTMSSDTYFSERAQRLRAASIARWGENRALEMVGLSEPFQALLSKLEKVARFREPVLVTGESGVGKEGVAQAVYLLSQQTAGRPYVAVNCPQFQEDNLTVSELFGHAKGSFTGALTDRRGAFEEADGGVLFLDEIGDLHPTAQAMLLRVLANGEIRPLGSSKHRSVEVRVVSATNRPLNRLVISQQFRYDLFFRLRHFHLEIPPLRERGDDWRLIMEYWLARLARKYGVERRFSSRAVRVLESYHWPGNVRQLIGVVSMGYAMADGELIEVEDFSSLLDQAESGEESGASLYERVARHGEDFWQVVYQGFMDRDLNREQVRIFIKKGLAASEGNYRQLLARLRLPASDYQRFMDFLRHHNLKPGVPEPMSSESA